MIIIKLFGKGYKINGFDILHKGIFNPDNKADVSHKHSKSEITDFPTSMPANGGNAATANTATIANKIAQIDTKNTNENPKYYMDLGIGVICELKTNTIIQLKNAFSEVPTYSDVTTYIIWNDSSGGLPIQVAINNAGIYYRTGVSNTVWETWSKVSKTSDIPNFPLMHEINKKSLIGSTTAAGYYTFAQTNIDPAEYSAKFKITVTSTANTNISHILYLNIQGYNNSIPIMQFDTRSNSQVAANTGLYYLRSLYPKIVNSGHRTFLEFYVYDSAQRDIKIELLEANNVELLETFATSSYDSGSHNTNTQNAYYSGIVTNGNFVGSVAGTATNAYNLFNKSFTAGEALIANDIIFLGVDNKWYKCNVASRTIPLGTMFARCANSYAINASVEAFPQGYFSLPAGLVGTINVRKDLFVQGQLNGTDFITSGIVTTELEPDYSYIRLGSVVSSTSSLNYDGNNRIYTVNSEGKISAIDSIGLAGGANPADFQDINNQLLNLSAPNTNVLPNSTGQFGLLKWKDNSGGKITSVTDSYGNGYYFKSSSFSTGAEERLTLVNTLSLTQNADFTLSADMLGSLTKGEIRIEVICRDANNVYIDYFPLRYLNTESGWKRKSITFTTPANTAKVEISLMIYKDTAGTDARWRRIKLERGKVATPYSTEADLAIENNGWTFYSNITELGLTIGSETIDSIVSAMPDKSVLYFIKATANTATIYPANVGLLKITRWSINRIDIEFAYGTNSVLGRWIGYYDSNITPKFTGWQKVVTEETVPIFKGGVGGKEGGQIEFEKPQSDTSFTAKIALDIYGDKVRFIGTTATGTKVASIDFSKILKAEDKIITDSDISAYNSSFALIESLSGATEKADALTDNGKAYVKTTVTSGSVSFGECVINNLKLGKYSLMIRLKSANNTIATNSIKVDIQKCTSAGVYSTIKTANITPTSFSSTTDYDCFYFDFDYKGKAYNNELKVVLTLLTQTSAYEVSFDYLQIMPAAIAVYSM